jgi:type IX secretion system PorP/SprF family membrane protein
MVHKIFFLLLLLNSMFASGQDIHFSQFNHIPLYQNPGNTGLFKGDYRFNAVYRSQWSSVTVPFSTLLVSADNATLVKNFGFGLLFLHDVAGDGKYRTIDFMPSVSYNIQLDKSGTNTLRPGIQLGLNFRELNAGAFYYDEQYNGYYYDPNLPNNENFVRQKTANFNFNTGIVYQWYKSTRKQINAGFAVYNIPRQNQGFFGQKIQRDIRFTVHARGQFKIATNWDIIPSLMLNFQGKYNEFIFGSEARYILKELRGDYRALYMGVFFRNRDAVYASIGIDYQNWFAGLSYDINISKLVPASKIRGGIEITLQYILKQFKPKKVNHRICPVYI